MNWTKRGLKKKTTALLAWEMNTKILNSLGKKRWRQVLENHLCSAKERAGTMIWFWKPFVVVKFKYTCFNCNFYLKFYLKLNGIKKKKWKLVFSQILQLQMSAVADQEELMVVKQAYNQLQKQHKQPSISAVHKAKDLNNSEVWLLHINSKPAII